MSDDFTKVLWEMFIAESTQHFDTIENVLVGGESGGDQTELVGELFRAFHSVKGAAGTLELSDVQRVAHKSEDLLGLVREGRAELNSEIVNVLILSVDVLREAVGEAAEIMADVAIESDVEERLLAVIDGIKSREQYSGGAPDVLSADLSVLPSHGKEIELHEDRELLEFYSETVTESADRLATIIATEGEGESVELLEMLALGAEGLGFIGIQVQLEDIGLIISQEDEEGDRKERLLYAAAQLQGMFRHAESESGLTFGCEQLQKGLSGAVEGVMNRLFEVAVEHLALWSDEAPEPAMEIQVALEQVMELSELHSLGSLKTLIPLSNDILRRVELGEVEGRKELRDLVVKAVVNVATVLRGEAKEIEREVETLMSKLKKAAAAKKGGDEEEDSATLKERLTAIVEQLDIRPELSEILTPAQAKQLEAALEKSETVLELLVDVEAKGMDVEQLMAWLQSDLNVVTNRTVFLGDRTWFEFLVSTPASLEMVKQAARHFDPDSSAIQIHSCKRDASKKKKKKVESSSDAKGGAKAQPQYLRVDSSTVDRFIDLVGAIMMDLARLGHLVDRGALRDHIGRINQEAVAAGLGTDALSQGLAGLQRQFKLIDQANQKIQRNLGRLQEEALELRVVPIELVFRRYPRLVRNLAQKGNKQIRVDITGDDVRIDKGLIDHLVDPLTHLVRNSVDHGVESVDERREAKKVPQAVISLSAVQRGNQVIVRVRDDGRGISREKVTDKAIANGLITAEQAALMSDGDIFRLIFRAGFSTAKEVTDTSGRGVGLDVVESTIERLGGRVEISSTEGSGTTFSLTLPLSVAIQKTLLVEEGGQVLAVPDRFLKEVISGSSCSFDSVQGQTSVIWRGAHLPIYCLSELLGRPRPRDMGAGDVIVLGSGKQVIGVIADRSLYRQDLYVEDLNERVTAIPGVGGAALLGDGRVALILDVEDIFGLAGGRFYKGVVDGSNNSAGRSA